MPRRPSWFDANRVMVSTAPTCGLSKGGRPLPRVDATTGKPVVVTDPETGEQVVAVDDRLLEDMEALGSGLETSTLRFVDRAEFNPRIVVPAYYDTRFEQEFWRALNTDEFEGFRGEKLRDLIDAGVIERRGGHGSPSAFERVGDVPYIKVSDIRAGLVNINPTNRVPREIAVGARFWGGQDSDLRAFDLLCPERTSKNIGDFAVLMPGQEQVVLTKEVIILRPGPEAAFDTFYLEWALTLRIVREQWKRFVFMQTNREDVGDRYLDLLLPIPDSREIGNRVSRPFREYFQRLAAARVEFARYLRESQRHHFFMSAPGEPTDED
jgi:hypothetical protein